jgi:general secretion pathway protein L
MWVACCQKTWLKNILDALEAHSIVVDRLVPEFEPVSNACHIYALEGSSGLEFILSNASGVVGFPKEALHAFSSALKDPLVIHFEPSVGDQVSALFQGNMQMQTRAQRLLESSQSTWDFARGQWAQGHLRRLIKTGQKSLALFLYHPEWKLARTGLLALLALNVIFLNSWAWQERQTLQAQKDQLSGILKSTFPDVQMVIEPKTQMLRAFRALQEKTASPSQGDFEHLLSALSRMSSDNPTFDPGQIQSLRYETSELTLVWKNQATSLANTAVQMPHDLEALGYRWSSQGQESRLRWSMLP